MTQFDFADFAEFRAPRYLCPRCLAIDISVSEFWGDWPEHWVFESDAGPYGTWTCPFCNLRFVGTRDFDGIHDYLQRWDCVLDHGIIEERFRALAGAAAQLRSEPKQRRVLGKPALRCLLEILNQAKACVHFTTWGLSWDFIGMFALLSHRVRVRGVVSRCDEPKARQITDGRRFGSENLEVIPLSFRDGDTSPHHKLIVIDGLLAITGSANLTIESWRKLDDGLEQVSIETRPTEVLRLNNTLFAPVWARLHPIPNDEINMMRVGYRWDSTHTGVR